MHLQLVEAVNCKWQDIQALLDYRSTMVVSGLTVLYGDL